MEKQEEPPRPKYRLRAFLWGLGGTLTGKIIGFLAWQTLEWLRDHGHHLI